MSYILSHTMRGDARGNPFKVTGALLRLSARRRVFTKGSRGDKEDACIEFYRL